MEKVNYITYIRKGLSNFKKRKVCFNEQGVEFDDTDFIKKQNSFIRYSDIKDFKFGIEWIKGYYFVIGRKYILTIRDLNNNKLNISFKSYYGYKKIELSEKYSNLLNTIWNNYVDDLVLKLITDIENGEEIEIAKTKIDSKRILYSKKTTDWKKISTKAYDHYYVIYSKNNEHYNKAYYFKDDWNIGVLYSLIETYKKKYYS